MDRTNRRPLWRIVLSGLLLVALVGVFVVRLVDIQVVRAEELNEAADDIRSREQVVYGARGDIVDRNGVVLAGTVMRWDIALSPKQAVKGPVDREVPDPDDPESTTTVEVPLEQVAAELGALVGRSGPDIVAEIEAKLAEDPDSDFMYVAKLADADTYEKVKELGIPWVEPWPHPSRRYPYGAVAGNLIGFVGDDGEALAGLELAQDTCLAAEDGRVSTLRSLKDWVSIPGTEVVLDDAHDGGTLQLTIDADLQFAVQRIAEARVRELEAEWAIVTVMEAKTGRLLAVADVPTVDPNVPTATDSVHRGSRAFTDPFEPGSTFKSLTTASVLDAGVATPMDGVVAPYWFYAPNGADFRDSSYHEDERLTLTGVMIDSSNTGMAQFGERLTNEQRYQYMLDFGLGRESEIGFLSEASGDIGASAEGWDNQTMYTTMFGQGLTVTAIQMASVYQTIANGGVRMPVSLVEGCTAEDGTVTEVPEAQGTRVISEEAARQTTSILEQVYTQAWLRKDWNIPGYRVAAKTGTAQVPDGQGGYRSEYLVSVSGFAPADDPQFVVSVSIMDAVKMNSSAASAPVFRDVMSQVLKEFRTIPSGAPAPELPATW